MEDINTYLKTLLDDDEIDDKCHDFLSISKERTSLFYMLPKIHKRLVNPPCRPIVSGNGCHTERISQFVDFYLQPTVKDLPSYIKDTAHFLQKLQKIHKLPNDTILATMDVASLYTNIPNTQGLEAVRQALIHSSPSRQLPKTFLSKVLSMNNFDFTGKHFLQVGGTAMGT